MMIKTAACALRVTLAASLAFVPHVLLAATPSITSFSPTSGPIGTTVVVTGTNLTGASAVTFDGVAATNFTVKSATQISATVPATGTGSIAVSTSGGMGKSSTSFTVTPGVLLAPTTGHPSIAVTVTGSGFGPYQTVDVYFDTLDTALAVSNSQGVVSIQLQVPTNAQPGTHWYTLDARATHYAAQGAFIVNTNWIMQGFAPAGTGANPFENTLNTGNVAGLTTAWSQLSDVAGSNPSPIIVENGNVFVGDGTGAVRAYSPTGSLLWTATEPVDFSASAPVESAGQVIFAGGSSVYAFKLTCRKDGGVCAPTWVSTLGTGVTVSAALTVYQNQIYVPGSDGYVHPLNPATGAVGTKFYAFDSASGAITTPISFGAEGSYFYGTADDYLQFNLDKVGPGEILENGAVSPVTVSNGRAFYTTGDGIVHALVLGADSEIGSTASVCSLAPALAPVVANDVLYAAGCASITAFEAGEGTVEWTIMTNEQVVGLSEANGVLYACLDTGYPYHAGGIYAYDARDGELLWSGGLCTAAPVVVNGSVFGTYIHVSEYSLANLSTSPVGARPDVSKLKPNYALPARETPEDVAATQAP